MKKKKENALIDIRAFPDFDGIDALRVVLVDEDGIERVMVGSTENLNKKARRVVFRGSGKSKIILWIPK